MAIDLNKCACVQMSLKGANCRPMTHCIRIYESMCKPYRTAEIELIDDENLITQLGLTTGDEVNFTVMDREGKTYSMTSYITAIPTEVNQDGIRERMITIVTATEAYFKDRANLVQASFKNIPVTAAASQVHSMFIGNPLQIAMPSIGMIAMDPIGSYIVSNDKPFKAIRDILNRATYGGVGTGSTVYFENKFSHVIGPLENIFATMGNQTDLIQKDTWGSDYRHVFGGADADKAIIASKLYKKEGPKQGGGGMVSAASQGQTVIDIAQRMKVIDRPATILGGISKFAAAFSGGGIKNSHQLTDLARNPLATDPAIKTLQEQLFQALVKDGTNYLLKVGIQAGLRCTVGKGVNVQLIAPKGLGASAMSGPMLCADVMHELYFDNRPVMGTTVIRAAKIG